MSWVMLSGCWRQPAAPQHDAWHILTAISICHAASSHSTWLMTYTNCCLYTVDPPDDEQQACSKHVEAHYRNKLIENSATCWFILYGCIRMRSECAALDFLHVPDDTANWHRFLRQSHTQQQAFHLDSDNSQNQCGAGVSSKPLAELSAACWSTIAYNCIP